MIDIQNLRFAYGDGNFQLNIEHLSVPQGQRRCWVGPSGSGKTTLLHLAAGIYTPDAGEIIVGEQEISRLRESARREFRISKLGLVFQDFALLDYLNVLDNILLPYRMSRALHLNNSVRERAQQLAERVGLGSFMSRKVTQLSQGERQRVAVCRSVITNPQLILADEPTANLDAINAAHVLDFLEGYSREQNATLIIVSHDQNVITRFDDVCDLESVNSMGGPVGGSIDV